MKENSDNPKNAVTLTIYTQKWLVDLNKNNLFCNPQIGSAWGTLARLDAKEWSGFSK